VVSAMARQERDGDTVMLKDVDWRRWVAPWGLRVDGSHGDVASKTLQSGASDHSDKHSAWSRAVSEEWLSRKYWDFLPS
jgi:hypothetical protein